MRKILLFCLMFFSANALFAQSYHTINIDGQNDFNSGKEKIITTSGSELFSYVTWDKDYIYIGYSGNTVSGPVTDNDRIIHIYLDTDPQKDPTAGTGTSNGLAWRNTPTLPFSANFHYAFKTIDNSEDKKIFFDGAWKDSSFTTSNYKNTAEHYWEVRIKRKDLGNPDQINLAAYAEEDWDSGEICGGIPSNIFTNKSGGGNISFNNHWLNYFLVDQFNPNSGFAEDNFQWMVRLKTFSGTLTDTTAYAGMGVNSSDELDSNLTDVPKPPAPPSNYVELFFPHPTWDTPLGPYFSRDLKHLKSLDSSTASWDFTINSDKINSDITIIPDNYSSIPSNYNILIYDTENDSTVDIRSSESYTFNSGSGGTRLFNLIIGNSLSPAQIDAEPISINFGSIKIKRDTTISVIISNLGDSTLVITDISISNSAFTFSGGKTYNIVGGSSIDIPVKFSPQSVQSYSGNLVIKNSDKTNPVLSIPLSGTGLNLFPKVSTDFSSIDFGNVKVDHNLTLPLKIYNTGDTTLVISNIVSTSSAFTYSGSSSINISKNDSAIISLTFEPNSASSFAGQFFIINNDPNTDTVTVALSGTGISSTFTKTFNPGWNLISIPSTANDSSAAALIGEKVSEFYLYNYSSDGGYSSNKYLTPGKGYWLGISDTLKMEYTGTALTDTVKVKLSSGWNLVGEPFIRQYPKNGILIQKDGKTISADSAVSLGWFQNTFYTFTNNDSSYSIKDTLSQWKGYWLAGLTDGMELIFNHNSAFGAPLEKESQKEVKPSDKNWNVTITAQNKFSKDKLLRFGVNEFATKYFDSKYDIVKPPVSPSGKSVQTYFEEENWSPYFSKYSSNITAPLNQNISGDTWNFKVKTEINSLVTLNWENIEKEVPTSIRNTYHLMLSGPGITNPVDMTTLKTYSFTAAAGQVYSFGINASTTSFNDVNPQNYKYQLEQNFPNPFNPSTVISFQVSKTERVTLQIYDVLGRHVTNLINEVKAPGQYQVEFNASNLASGIYYYKLTAGSFIQTKKMILMK